MSYQLELRHFKYFLAVADELHYRKAAEKLFISQPGLSRQIKQMETILETQLFVRTKKKVALTPAGDYLRGELQVVINQLDHAQKQVKRIGKGDIGEIRIGFLGSAMQNVVPRLLLNLKEQHSGIKTNLEELNNQAQIAAIQKDKLDLGFVRVANVPPEVSMQSIYEDTFSIVLPKDHFLNEKQFKSMKQLADDDFILFAKDYSPLYFATVMSICENAGFTPKVSHKSVHAQTIFKLVENHLGVAIVPTSLQFGFDMNVKFIELKKIKQKAVLSVIWKKENRNPALKHCLDLILNSSSHNTRT